MCLPWVSRGWRLLKAEGPSQFCPASSVSVTASAKRTTSQPGGLTQIVILIPVGQERGFARSSSSGTLVRLLRARPRHLLAQPWGGDPLPRVHRGCWQVPQWLLAGDLAAWASLWGGSNGAVGFIKVNERERQTDRYIHTKRETKARVL